MAGKVTPMSVKVMAAVVAVGEGEALNVSALCRDAGVSRKTFYKWVARYRAEGMDGLTERSRRPHRSPQRTPLEVEDQVVRLRKELIDAGFGPWGDDDPVAPETGCGGRGSVGCRGASHLGATGTGRAATEEAAEVVVATFRSLRSERVLANRRDGLGVRHGGGEGVQHHR
jgi:hypothetical protein